MAGNAMDLATFLGHESRGDSRSQFLRGWKKLSPPVVDTWLHTRSPIVALWQHNMPKIQIREDKQTRVVTREVWGGNQNCFEAEETLRQQYFRDKATNERKLPPQVCPVCLMIEAVRSLVDAGKLDWRAPLFRFVGDDPTKTRELRAAGLYNAFGRDDLSEKQKREMAEAGISPKYAWRDNVQAKCNYLFRVVDHAKPDAGVQIAIETTLLGDKVKRVIRDAMTALGDEAGNPLANPYAIRWEHHPGAKAFGDTYHAVKMDSLKLTPEIKRLIIGDPPDVKMLVAPLKASVLRADLESHYCGPKGLLDFDAIFEKAEALGDGGAGDDDFDYGANVPSGDRPPDVEHKRAEVTPLGAPQAATPAQGAAQTLAAVPADEDVECDECAGLMKASDTVCPTCRFDYASQAKVAAPPPAPARKKRGAAKADAPAAPAAAATDKPRAGWPADPGDEIGF